MHVALMTREFPPFVYGGAGVHVDHLVPALRAQPDVEVDVLCSGAERPGATCVGETDARMPEANPALAQLSTDLVLAHLAARDAVPDVLHSHTWYTNLAGHVGGLLHERPHVVTAHSLEPLRPWKAEQLGGGYRLSSWAERTAYAGADAIIAVSRGMREDVLSAYPRVDPAKVRVVHNGIDADFYRPDPDTDVLERLGVDPTRPSVAFVGRITRQKGVPHLLRAMRGVDPQAQLVLLAGSPDTPELARETEQAVATLTAERTGVVWVSQMLARDEVRQVLTHATLFVCPSIYEPQGIVNLEAMGCETAVVASDVGGIPEVVVHGETGVLVHYDPRQTADFEAGLTEAINDMIARPDRAAEMGRAGRVRAIESFSWDSIAAETVAVYRSVLRG
jgi:alpha-maltose-1-phosphate synthase